MQILLENKIMSRRNPDSLLVSILLWNSLELGASSRIFRALVTRMLLHYRYRLNEFFSSRFHCLEDASESSVQKFLLGLRVTRSLSFSVLLPSLSALGRVCSLTLVPFSCRSYSTI